MFLSQLAVGVRHSDHTFYFTPSKSCWGEGTGGYCSYNTSHVPYLGMVRSVKEVPRNGSRYPEAPIPGDQSCMNHTREVWHSRSGGKDDGKLTEADYDANPKPWETLIIAEEHSIFHCTGSGP